VVVAVVVLALIWKADFSQNFSAFGCYVSESDLRLATGA